MKCLVEYKMFENKTPSVACIVYKSLVHWHSFEAEKTYIFDRIIRTIRSSVEVASRLYCLKLHKSLHFCQIAYSNFNMWLNLKVSMHRTRRVSVTSHIGFQQPLPFYFFCKKILKQVMHRLLDHIAVEQQQKHYSVEWQE